jgi:predicted nuclease of predicted toxin-antitoxin system
VAEGLKRRGIKAYSALEKGMVGAEDIEHFNCAAKIESVIFTHDHHFLEIAGQFTKEGKTHYGVIFAEMNKLGVGECIKRLALYAEVLATEEMMNQIEFL